MTTEIPILKGRGYWADAWHRLRRNPFAMVCLAVVLLYVIIALLVAVGWIAGDYNQVHYDLKHRPPSRDYWMGTDIFGRDVFSRVLYGTKIALWIGLMANAISIPIGLIFGVLAGYFGKRIDDAVVYVYTTLASIPGILKLMALAYVFQDRTVLGVDLSGLNGVILALGISGWVGTCRLIRGETLKLKESEYVMAARALGASHFRIIFRHIVPNLLHIVIILFSLGFVGAIKAEVILTYLGLGAKVGTPSWGDMINGARSELLQGHWWELTGACLALFFIVLALNILGDALRDALDPRLRQ